MSEKSKHYGKKELESLTKKAESGDVIAQYELGAVFATGFLDSEDLTQAFQWYMKAANQGHLEAKWNVGLMLVNGEGVAVDLKEGLRLIELAANENCYGACLFLSDAYRSSLYGMSKDNGKSNYWRKQAEEHAEINTAKVV